MSKYHNIDEIVSEYITNSDYDACDAMEDIIQVLDEQEPHYYNKIKEKRNEEKEAKKRGQGFIPSE